MDAGGPFPLFCAGGPFPLFCAPYVQRFACSSLVDFCSVEAHIWVLLPVYFPLRIHYKGVAHSKVKRVQDRSLILTMRVAAPPASTRKDQYVSDSDSENDSPRRGLWSSQPNVVPRDGHLCVHKEHEGRVPLLYYASLNTLPGRSDPRTCSRG